MVRTITVGPFRAARHHGSLRRQREQGEDDYSYCDALSIADTNQKHSWVRYIGGDSGQDLAVLASCQKFLEFGYLRTPEKAVEAGESVYAFGYPMGGGSRPKITDGIVSSLLGFGDNATFLQHTAAVQRGNSGGPLLDKAGLIVGVNTRAATHVGSGSNEGVVLQNVGFAVKSNIVQSFLLAHDIAFQTKNSSIEIGAVEIVNRSKEYTVEVTCWMTPE